MAKKLRITRNAEADQLLAHIRADDAMMNTLKTSIQDFWQRYQAEFAAAGRSITEPSPMLIPPTTNLLIALIERKVETLKATPQLSRSANELEALSKKASLIPVADDLLKLCLPGYRPMAQSAQFEVINESTRDSKPWWQFW